MLLRTFRNKGMCSVDAVAVERAAIGSGSLEHVDVSGQDMVSEMVMSVTMSNYSEGVALGNDSPHTCHNEHALSTG